MFDDAEQNQDEKTQSPARLRFSYWLVGLDPDSDPRLGGQLSGGRQTGITPRTLPADPTQTEHLQFLHPPEADGPRWMQTCDSTDRGIL